MIFEPWTGFTSELRRTCQGSLSLDNDLLEARRIFRNHGLLHLLHLELDQLNPALSNPNAASDEPGIVLNPMFMRFQALISMIAKVRSEISFSDNCPRTRSKSSSGTP